MGITFKTDDGYTFTFTPTIGEVNSQLWTDGEQLWTTLENTLGQAMTGDLYIGDFQVAEIRMDEDELVIKFNTARIDATDLVDEHFPSFDSENVAVEFHDDAATWCSMWFESFDLGR